MGQRITEQEQQYCPKLTLAQVTEAFGDQAGGMLRHYQDRQTDNLIEQDKVRNSTTLTAMQKAVGAVFLKWLNNEALVNNAVRHCERVIYMRRNPGRMAVIPIELAKAVPIESLAEFEGLKRVGNKIKAYCPLGHKEKSYTFVINADNTFICHNCKDEGGKGSSIDFIMKRDGVDIGAAIRWLQKAGK